MTNATADPGPTKAAEPADTRSVEELQAEVEAARDDLVASISELKAQTSPKALVDRGGRTVTGFFTDEFGGIRPERVAIAGAVVLGVIVIGILRRRR